MLQSHGSQRVGDDLGTEQQQHIITGILTHYGHITLIY